MPGLPRERLPLCTSRHFTPHVWRLEGLPPQAYPLCQHAIGLAQTPEAEALSDPPTLTQILRSDVGFTFLCFIYGSPFSYRSSLNTVHPCVSSWSLVHRWDPKQCERVVRREGGKNKLGFPREKEPVKGWRKAVNV